MPQCLGQGLVDTSDEVTAPAAGRKDDADRAIAAYELKHAADDPGGIAAFYACRRDTERTIQWLRRFVAKQAGGYHDLPNREACFKTAEPDARFLARPTNDTTFTAKKRCIN